MTFILLLIFVTLALTYISPEFWDPWVTVWFPAPDRRSTGGRREAIS